MNYRTRHLAWVTLAFLLLNAVAWVLAHHLILAGFTDLEAEFAGRQLARARGALEREAEYLRRVTVSEAVWDATYAFMAHPDLEFIRSNFSSATFKAGRLNGILLLDEGGNPLFARGYDLEGEKEVPLSPEIFDLLSRLHAAVRVNGHPGGRAGLLATADEPLLVAMAPILASSERGPSRGVAIFFRTLDKVKVATLSELIQLELRVGKGEAGSSPDSAEGDADAVLRPIDADSLIAATTLTDLLGGRDLSLEVLLDRAIVRAGRQTILYFKGWVGGTSLLLGGLVFWILNRSALAQEKRAERDALYRRLVSQSGEAVYLLDDAGKIIEANRRAGDMFGVGSVPREFFSPGSQAGGLPVLAGGVAGGAGAGAKDLVLTRADGSSFSAEVSCSVIDLSGKHYHLLLVRDITARVQAQAALRLSEERYRLLFESNPLPMWVYDVETLQFMAVNEAALLHYGYSRAEFLGMTIRDVRPPEEIPALLPALAMAGDGLGKVGVWKHRKKDGSVIDVDITLHSLEFDGCRARMVVAHDVTEEIRIRQEADRAGRLAALGELVAGIAHEINNPCGMLLLNLSLLRDVLADVAPVLESLEAQEEELTLGGLDLIELREQLPQTLDDMLRGARHIRSIVEELKKFARPETSSAFAPFDLNDILRGAIRLTGNQIDKATGRFESTFAEELPPTRGREQQIEQVVINLLLNACQAIPDPGRGIRVQTRHDPKRRRNIVEVTDEGVGIPRENLDKVTNPFFTTKRESGGTGLGLSVSARIVREHEGELEFKSGPGRGTTVLLSLPVNEEQEE